MGVSQITPFFSECRSQALSTGLPVTTTPIMPHCLPVCVQNSELDTVTGGQRRQQCKFRFPWCLCLCWILRGREFCFLSHWCRVAFTLYSGPYLASYRAKMFLQRPQSFRNSATCCRSAAFSRSRKEARTVIWFSFSRRASRERLAATLFFFLLDQYFSSWGSKSRWIRHEGSVRAQDHNLRCENLYYPFTYTSIFTSQPQRSGFQLKIAYNSCIFLCRLEHHSWRYSPPQIYQPISFRNWFGSLLFWHHCLFGAHQTWHTQQNEPTFLSSGTNTFLAFLIIGCGFSSSSENLCLRGLNSSPPGTLDRTRSVGSGWKLTSTSIASGSIGDGVLRSLGLRSTRTERRHCS